MRTGSRYEPACQESLACRRAGSHHAAHTGDEGSTPCECSGWGDGDMYRMEQVDSLKLPADLAAGDWVLGWRWDCEESTQIWASCSDVTIVAAS